MAGRRGDVQERTMTHRTDQRLLHGFRDELQSERLLPGLTSGALMGIKEVIFALSIGSLIFSGDLAPYLAYGIGIALATQVVMLIGVALGSSVPGVIGGLQDSPAVILAVIAAALVDGLSAASAEEQLATVLVAIAITALLTGLFLLALGAFKLGGLVRFIPYPVVGGFLAGTGWLLVQGSFGVMTGTPFSLANIPLLFQPDLLVLWVPGVLLALALLFGQRHIDHFLTMPAILVGAIVLFYLGLLVTGMSFDQAVNRGLLLGGVSSEAIWQPLVLQSLLAANWPAILEQGGNIAVVLLLSAVGLLLNASGIELAIRRDVELNRELRVAGLANILCGLGGGAVGYHALDLSTLCFRIGARGRLPGLLAAALCAIVLFAGTPLLAFAPVPILGGLLLFLGLDFLVEWVIDGWPRLSRADYAVVLLILVVIALTDFLTGVGVGLVATIVLFVLNYSRINVVHHALSGGEIKSNVERCTYHRRRLRELGQHTYVLELRGFIFFGTANTLLQKIRARVADTEQPQVRFIILDFRRVSGLDSSAVLCFVKARQLADAQGIVLVLTHTSGQISRLFEPGGLFEDDSGVRIFPDLDHGLEWCEDQLLEIEQVTLVDMPLTLRAQLMAGGFERPNAVRLNDFLERVEVEKGDYLVRQDDEADDLFFIERGMVSIYLELEDGNRVRLQKLGVGTIVGELGLYLGTRRTASVIADWPTTAYRLTHAALSEMKEKEPELAAAFHEYAARFLSERLVATNRSLEAVLR
jgi:SulP family sulfate permease